MHRNSRDHAEAMFEFRRTQLDHGSKTNSFSKHCFECGELPLRHLNQSTIHGKKFIDIAMKILPVSTSMFVVARSSTNIYMKTVDFSKMVTKPNLPTSVTTIAICTAPASGLPMNKLFKAPPHRKYHHRAQP